MTFSLCGCDLFTVDTDELLSPPELTGDMYPIEQALKKSVANTDYTLKYPSKGERRSAIVLEDVDGDNGFEAFAFYSINDGEQTDMYVNVIDYDGKNWHSVDTQSISASGIEKIEFCDFDGDGVKEIVIGWEIYAGSEKQIGVYSLSKKSLKKRLLENYTGFLCCDLDEDGADELFINLLSGSGDNKGVLYSFTTDSTVQKGGCVMDGKVTSASDPVFAPLSSGKGAIYIDETKGIGAITEVLTYAKGELQNGLLDTSSTLENTLTLRASVLSCADINGDGVLEIPVASDLPNADKTSADKLYYTNWCAYNGEVLTVKQVSIMNTIDKYAINLNEKLIGKVAVLKDTDKRIRTLFVYDAESGTVGNKIMTLKTYTEGEWKSKDLDKTGIIKLSQDNDKIHTAVLFPAANEFGIDKDAVKQMFMLYDN